MSPSKKTAAPPPFPFVIETFHEMGWYEKNQLVTPSPSVGNGAARVRRYRVTVELIDELDDVILERILALYDRPAVTFHDRETLRAYARRALKINLQEVIQQRQKRAP